MTNTTQNIIEEVIKRFRETKFAKGGGLSFECSDYEGMYSDLEKFLSSELTTAITTAKEGVVEAAVNKLSNKPPCTKDSPCGCHFGEVFHADDKCACDLVDDVISTLKGNHEDQPK